MFMVGLSLESPTRMSSHVPQSLAQQRIIRTNPQLYSLVPTPLAFHVSVFQSGDPSRGPKPQGFLFLYFTMEIANPKEIEEAYKLAQAMNVPVAYGEWVNDDVYHFYPMMEQVRE